jgi:hypothetical protein
MRTKLIITESQFNELIYGKLGILSEASKKKVLIDKLGLSEYNAELLDKACGGLSVWMANKLIDYQIKISQSWNGDNVSKEYALERLNGGNLKKFMPKVTEIMDWIRVGLNGNVGQYKNLSIEDLETKSKEWHNSLGIGNGVINYNEKHEIIKDFRDENGNGFYWADLDTKNSGEECERMGHCGRSSYGFLYSLRETRPINDKYKINKSHLTAAIGPDGIMYQLKGPKNSKPNEAFHSYILPLFDVKDEDDEYLIKGFGSEYASQMDFKLTDLPDSVIKQLYEDRPELFKSRSLQRKLVDLGIIEKPVVDYNITIEISPDYVGRYVDGDYVINRYKKKITTPAGQQYERTVEVTLFETILSGDVWDLWQNWEPDWKGALSYDVDNDNEQKIRHILKYLAQKDNPDFSEETFNDEDTDSLIEDWDEDHEIRSAIGNAVSNAESDAYASYLYDGLKDALEEYGTVEKMNDDGIILHVDVEKYIADLDDEEYEDYVEERCNGDLKCVFEELAYQDAIEKPRCSFDDRYYPNINTAYFNEILSERLYEVEYHYIK